MKRTRMMIKNLLLGFVLVSIGFALGKHSQRCKVTSADSATADSALQSSTPVTVRVYYMHASFRCTTCNTIEKMTLDLLNRQFGGALKDGQIQWREVDFQENDVLARQFDVITSCVVVARVQGETVLDFQRLDKVWTLMKETPKFDTYISDAIHRYLR